VDRLASIDGATTATDPSGLILTPKLKSAKIVATIG